LEKKKERSYGNKKSVWCLGKEKEVGSIKKKIVLGNKRRIRMKGR